MFHAPGAPTQPALFAAPATPTATPPAPAPRRNGLPAPTPEQEAILDGYWCGEHLNINALAGTGKTTSLQLIAHARPDRPGCYLAYNRAIADAAARKFPPTVHTGTAHSYAYRAIGKQYAHRLSGGYNRRGQSSKRLPANEVATILGLQDVQLGDQRMSDVRLARLADATVARFCESADPQPAAEHIPYPAGMEDTKVRAELAKLVLPAAAKMWADICDPGGRLWFTHDHYLKMWQLSGPVLPFDYVLFDEAQDANPVIAAIVAAQQHAQLVYVGDRNQQLYAWRGAVDAMNGFDGLHLPLTKSFRFGPAIADEANAWLALLGCPLQVTGHEPVGSTIGGIPAPDAVLCRTNGGAMGQVIEAQWAGRKVALVGGGKDIRRFAFAAKALMGGRGCDMPELAAFTTWSQLTAYVQDERSGQDLQVLVKLVQRYGPSTLIDTVDRLVDPNRADLVVSTAHRAKGLEWPRVAIGGDFQPPDDGDKPDPAELMLAYVAVTRAQNRLDPGSLSWRHDGRLIHGHWQQHQHTDNGQEY